MLWLEEPIALEGSLLYLGHLMVLLDLLELFGLIGLVGLVGDIFIMLGFALRSLFFNSLLLD